MKPAGVPPFLFLTIIKTWFVGGTLRPDSQTTQQNIVKKLWIDVKTTA